MPGPEARQIIENDLNVSPFESVFLDFENEPVGSASIGQVHVARLAATGEKVAIKVLTHSLTHELVFNDLSTFKLACT